MSEIRTERTYKMITRIVLPQDIFDDDAQAIVIPVNCVGVMGAGLAKQAKERYEHLFSNYKTYCGIGMMSPGGILGVQTKDLVTGKKRMIICLATKNHWRDPSQMEWIQAGVTNLKRYLDKLKLTSVATPLIGSGLGHLDKKTVEEAICNKFSNSLIDMRIYCEGPKTK